MTGAVSAADLSPQELVEARKLSNAKCLKCHKFYNPANYTDEKWREWMTKMSRKSKLKPDQEQLLSRYFDLFRADTNSGPDASRPRP